MTGPMDLILPLSPSFDTTISDSFLNANSRHRKATGPTERSQDSVWSLPYTVASVLVGLWAFRGLLRGGFLCPPGFSVSLEILRIYKILIRFKKYLKRMDPFISGTAIVAKSCHFKVEKLE